jgi:hypothetical protein
VKKADYVWALIVTATVCTILVSISGKGTRTTDAHELRGAAIAPVSDLEDHGEIWTIYLDDERYVSIFPDGSVELPPDLPVDDVAWRFWLALAETWPDFREQICAGGTR